MHLKKLEKTDLPFLLEIRNDDSTRKYLENDSMFTLEECEKWYDNLKTDWYIIEVDPLNEESKKEPVGYIRTNENDDIGVDIHMNYRRRGYATQAYKLFLQNKESANLWVFEDNIIAVRLYKKLGFKLTDTYKIIREKKYVFMTYNKPEDFYLD